MKMRIKQLLGVASDSHRFGVSGDALSMIIQNTENSLSMSGGVKLSDEELGMVAGGVDPDPLGSYSLTETLSAEAEW